MAYIKEIDRKCKRASCASGAVVQVIAEDFAVIGDFCRPHGREEQKTQDEREKSPTVSGTNVSPIKDVTAR